MTDRPPMVEDEVLPMLVTMGAVVAGFDRVWPRIEIGCIHPEHNGKGDRLILEVDGSPVYSFTPAAGKVWEFDGNRLWGPLP